MDKLKKRLLKQSSSFDRTIVGVWATDCLYNPMQNGRIFKYKFIIIQTNMGQGCAYSDQNEYDVNYLESLIGKDCLNLEINDSALNVACMDSLAECISYNYSVQHLILEGKSNDKLHMRTALIIEEAKRLIGSLQGKKILNVGVVGDIVKGFFEMGCDVVGSDFDDTIIGKKLFGEVSVISGNYTLELLTKVDLAVVTGMTITTKTLNCIIKTCKEYNIKLIVFAETGANMGQYYVHQGVDCYIGEKYPFYIFDGKSEITIIRRQEVVNL